MLSALVTPPFTRKSAICSATWIATFTWASFVDAPRCGVEMKPGVPNRGDAFAGTCTNTYSAAPVPWPEHTATLSAPPQIKTLPAQLMQRTPLHLYTGTAVWKGSEG